MDERCLKRLSKLFALPGRYLESIPHGPPGPGNHKTLRLPHLRTTSPWVQPCEDEANDDRTGGDKTNDKDFSPLHRSTPKEIVPK